MVGKILFLALLGLVFVKPSSSVFRDCDSSQGNGKPVSKVKCNGEENFSKCLLSKGKNASLEVDFVAQKSTNTLTSKCHGIIGGVPIPFTDIDPNGCDGLNPHCPVQSGTTYVFKTQIPVRTVYPSIKLMVKWEAVAADGSDVFCILIPAEIQ